MNIETIKNKECCGCSACKSVCPKGAIYMEQNELGFYVPRVDNRACIDCGLCFRVCSSKSKLAKAPITAYAVKHNNANVLKRSSSGGASYALIETMIKMGGVVYGVIYDDEFNVVIKKANTIEECELFYGSKYVAADPKDSFLEVLDDLNSNRKVLYIATSCYISGLLAFLEMKKAKMDNLVTVDLICHGTPSPKLFKDYVSFINRKGRLECIDFRSKKKAWEYGKFNCLIKWKNGREELNTVKSRLFINLFFSDNCLRDYCYECPYIKERAADITISDYWGIEKQHSSFYSSSGVSAVQINSIVGENYFKLINNITVIQSSPDKIIENNLNKATSRGKSYDDFWSLYRDKGFISVARKYGGYNLRGYLRLTVLHKIWVFIRYGQKE